MEKNRNGGIFCNHNSLYLHILYNMFIKYSCINIFCYIEFVYTYLYIIFQKKIIIFF